MLALVLALLAAPAQASDWSLQCRLDMASSDRADVALAHQGSPGQGGRSAPQAPGGMGGGGMGGGMGGRGMGGGGMGGGGMGGGKGGPPSSGSGPEGSPPTGRDPNPAALQGDRSMGLRLAGDQLHMRFDQQPPIQVEVGGRALKIPSEDHQTLRVKARWEDGLLAIRRDMGSTRITDTLLPRRPGSSELVVVRRLRSSQQSPPPEWRNVYVCEEVPPGGPLPPVGEQPPPGSPPPPGP